jgi:ankyrin repeat protein
MDLFEMVSAKVQGELAAALEAAPARALLRNDKGATLLSFAIYNSNEDAASAIRAVLPELTPYEAILVGDVETVRAAITNGWDANTLAPDGFSALGLAAFFRRPDIFDLLLPLTNDINQRADNEQQVAALHAAAAVKDSAAVEKLLRAGANPNLAQQQGFRALHVAAMHGDAVMTGLLLLFGAAVTIPSDDGRTAIDFAREGGHEWLARLLTAKRR